MKEIVTAAQAKEIDRCSIEEIGIPAMVLMERAALRFTECLSSYLDGQGEQRKWLVVCGSGNNGGDGMAIARLLFEKGWDCCVYLAGNQEHMTDSAKIQWKILQNLGVPIRSEFLPEPETWIIDALFGVGLSRKVTGRYADLIESMNQYPCVCVDLPSGLDADTGQAMVVGKEGNTAVKAKMTVTFGSVKAGLLLGIGRGYAGKVYVEDIGFPKRAVKSVQNGWYFQDDDLADLLPRRTADSHKGTYGKVVVFAGFEHMIGAAYYAAAAAYRVGAGLVEIVTEKCHIPVLAGMLPAAIYTDAGELFLPEQRETVEHMIKTADAIVFGPGTGQSKLAEYRMESVLRLCSQNKKRLVLDADGLNLLARHKEWYEWLYSDMVLTPHLKEMSRISGLTLSDLKENMIASAKNFASRYGVILLLKDSRSVITDGTEYWINVSGNHGMAVGGSGDILSGILGGFFAQAPEAMDQAKLTALASYLHGRAGDAARNQCGAYAMTGDDILEGLTQILKAAEQKMLLS